MAFPNELRVFISSTFRDLREEREHLVKKIFPEIRALCRSRGITFTEVDLRWGLTDEDVVLGQVIRICLEEVERCRPYFIGITGERYGYVPELLEFHKDADLLKQFPWLEDAAMEQASILDLEFRHGALNDPATAHASSRFFFRRARRGTESAVDEAEMVRLEALKERVRDSGFTIEEFRDPASLGEAVHDTLMEIIERDFAGAVAPSPLEEERASHRAFADSRRHAYIPNAAYLQRLNDWLGQGERPLVIYAESGSGKSSLVSYWCEQLRRRQPELPVIEHYVGIGAGSSDHLAIMFHVMSEIKERFERAEEIPSKPEEIERAFANWLGFNVGAPMLIIIDGINQLSGHALDLHWLPPTMPPGVRLIISSTVEQSLVDLRARGWETLGMQPLSEKEREAVVVRFLAEYHKALSAEHVHRIAADVKCSHPLFLRTLLEELRLEARHETIARELERYIGATGTEDLFQLVLERMEEDFSTRTMRQVMSLLWCSRGGLTEGDLQELTGISRLKLSTMLGGLDYHLVRREGVLTFFHDYLRRAVEKRYLSSKAREEHYCELAIYFEAAPVTLRSTQEALYAREQAAATDSVTALLVEIPRFELLWRAERYEVLRFWSTSEPAIVAAAYRDELAQWIALQAPAPSHEADVVAALANMLEVVGALEDTDLLSIREIELRRASGDRHGELAGLLRRAKIASRRAHPEDFEALFRESEGLARELDDRPALSVAMATRGVAYKDRGEYAEALACFAEQEGIARELGDVKSIAASVGSRGAVHVQRGEYDDALACIAESEGLYRQLGDRAAMGVAVSNRGVVHFHRGDMTNALACSQEWEELSRAIGHREGIADAVGNRGLVHSVRGEYEQALMCLYEQEAIARDLDNRRIVALAIGNRGLIHFHRGELEQALACFAEEEEISRALGDRYSIALAIGNSGCARMDMGELDQALVLLAEATAMCRESGDRWQLVHWLTGSTEAYLKCLELDAMPDYLPRHVDVPDTIQWRTVVLRTARALAEESMSIARDSSLGDMLYLGRTILARIEAAEGDVESARRRIDELLVQAEDDEQHAECHYWMWKLRLNPTSDHRSDAERLYSDLHALTPKHSYRTVLDELRAGSVL